MRPVSAYEHATLITPEPDDASFGGSLAFLYQIAWGKRHMSILFHDHAVKRDVESIPQKVVEVLYWHQDSVGGLLSRYHVESILVRKDYLSLLRDLLMVHGDKNAMDIDTYSRVTDIRIEDLSKPLEGSAIVIGSPGIGKSTFLIFVLALRTLAGLPTLFQIDNGGFYIICEEGVFSIRTPVTSGDLLELYIPRYIWMLFDCGRSVVTVPEEFTSINDSVKGFILQAASPRVELLEWRKKADSRIPQLWMAPWTLEELIEGRDLQTWRIGKERPSELQLSRFCMLFGRSARAAYAHATQPSDYESLVSGEIRTLTMEKFCDLITHPEGLERDTAFSHLVVMVTPDPADRKNFTLAIASNHLTDMVLECLRMADQQAALHLYSLFLSCPRTRSSARYLLERAAIEKFLAGGQWTMTEMERRVPGPVNTHWHSRRAGSSVCYLRLGHQGRSISVEESFVTPPDGFGPLPCFTYAEMEDTILRAGFYVPESLSQPTLHAFIYDSERTRATMFQMMVSKEHKIPEIGLDRLCDLGIEIIDLVVVTCPMEEGDMMDVFVPKTHEKRLRKVYHLVFADR